MAYETIIIEKEGKIQKKIKMQQNLPKLHGEKVCRFDFVRLEFQS